MRCGKSVRSTVLHFFTIQLLLYSSVIAGSNGSANTPSGADFLKNVIGNLHRPHLANTAFKDRIDVIEHIPNDVSQAQATDEFKILSKQPFGGQNINRPVQKDANSNSPAESLLTQMISQFLKNEYQSDTQSKVVNQGTPQSFNSAPGESIQNQDGIAGYNYVFYPLDNKALQQLQNSGNNLQQIQQYGGNNLQQVMQQQIQQNSVADTNSEQNQVTKPKVQPLFVAMAGFVGVAVVVLSALIFIPILPISSLTSKAVLKRAPEELASLTKLVAESIDGKDCSERIACEVGRAMRSMQVGNKPIRMMEIMLPPTVAKQLAQIRRSASKKETCHFIMCKRNEGTLQMVAKLKKTNNKTIHDVREIFNMEQKSNVKRRINIDRESDNYW